MVVYHKTSSVPSASTPSTGIHVLTLQWTRALIRQPKKIRIMRGVPVPTDGHACEFPQCRFADTTGLDSAGAASVELASVLLTTSPGTHYLINCLAELGTVAAGVKVVTPSSA
jgi:hypothetical protein